MVPIISLADLIQQTAEFAMADDIYLLIAGGRLYVDLYAEPLVEPVKVRCRFGFLWAVNPKVETNSHSTPNTLF
jgi:hypothetical protein